MRRLVAWLVSFPRASVISQGSGGGPPDGGAGGEPPTGEPRPDDSGLVLEVDNSWERLGIEIKRGIDPALRVAVSLLEALDFGQLRRRTGIRITADGKLRKQRLPLFLELADNPRGAAETLSVLMTPAGEREAVLHIPRAYLNEARVNPRIRVVAAELELDEADFSVAKPHERAQAYADGLRRKLAALINDTRLRQVSLPAPLQPCLEDSLRDIELPVDRQVKSRTIDGDGVIVGIIDDGCALAHRNFLWPGTHQSRIAYLWDQSRTAKTGGWTTPVDAFGKQDFDGLELANAAINAAIAKHADAVDDVIMEDAVYGELGYDLGLASHGTHVMDIAAGNGTSLAGTEGVAPAAQIIFVQLPADLVEQGGPLLENHMLHGVAYIFARARKLALEQGMAADVPAVVNISYGGYGGPHDGRTPLPLGMDQWLDAQTDRAIVVSAGNGFEADCHAMGALPVKGSHKALRWIVSPHDPTSNLMQIWYEGSALEVSITPPGATSALKPAIGLGGKRVIRRQSDQKIIGWITHLAAAGLNRIEIMLCATVGEDASKVTSAASATVPLPALTAPAPSGVWEIGLENTENVSTTFHAWIERDDLGRRGVPRRQQTRFDPAHASPDYTLAGLATGKHTICVGAYNTATGEACRYSACGPTRDGRDRPDVCAPAEEDAAGRGILCASSRRAQPSRMNGTSAAAPHVTGLVALAFQFNRDAGGQPLTSQDLRQMLTGGAASAQKLPPPPPRKLEYNRHQEVDPHRPAGKKQRDFWNDVIGGGKINVPEAVTFLPKP